MPIYLEWGWSRRKALDADTARAYQTTCFINITSQSRSDHVLHGFWRNITGYGNDTIATPENKITGCCIIPAIEKKAWRECLFEFVQPTQLASSIFEADNIGMLGKTDNSTVVHVTTSAPGNIVENLRYLNRIYHYHEVLVQPLLRWLVVIRRHQKACIGSGLFGTLRQAHRLRG